MLSDAPSKLMYKCVARCTRFILKIYAMIVIVKLPPVGTSGKVLNKWTVSSWNHCTPVIFWINRFNLCRDLLLRSVVGNWNFCLSTASIIKPTCRESDLQRRAIRANSIRSSFTDWWCSRNLRRKISVSSWVCAAAVSVWSPSHVSHFENLLALLLRT